MSDFQPRQPRGVPVGGQWATAAHAESGLALLPSSLSPQQAAERHQALLDAGYVPAVVTPGLDPATTAGIDQWWGDHFVTAEYRASGEGFAQMPDDATPGMSDGNALSGRRRTHRVRYRGQDVQLRMPSAAAIKRFAAQSGEGTFDVPVGAQYPDASGVESQVQGWVRVTRSPGGRWSAVGLGFAGESEAVAEGVSAILEARRPSFALRDAGSLITRHRERLAAQGAPLQSVTSQWISAVGYDEASGVMATQTANGNIYGHLVSKARAQAVAEAASPGAMFNRLVKGSDRVEVSNCPSCGRFFSASSAHTCPTPAGPEPGLVRNERAQRVATAVLGAKARAQTAAAPSDTAPAPRAFGEHVAKVGQRTIDVQANLAGKLSRRSARSGEFGPPGWTQGIAEHFAPFTSETYVPYTYSEYTLGERTVTHSNGDGLIRFAGLGALEARLIGSAMTRKQLSERQNDGPTQSAILAAAARNPGVVEVHGYVVGPDRSDERFTAEGVFIYDDTIGSQEQALDAARGRFGLDHLELPDEVMQVENPWRPGERAWRLWWE